MQDEKDIPASRLKQLKSLYDVVELRFLHHKEDKRDKEDRRDWESSPFYNNRGERLIDEIDCLLVARSEHNVKGPNKELRNFLVKEIREKRKIKTLPPEVNVKII